MTFEEAKSLYDPRGDFSLAEPILPDNMATLHLDGEYGAIRDDFEGRTAWHDSDCEVVAEYTELPGGYRVVICLECLRMWLTESTARRLQIEAGQISMWED